MKRLMTVMLVLFVAGCDDDDGVPPGTDAGPLPPGVDGGPGMDAGPLPPGVDGGPGNDAGPRSDGGPPDPACSLRAPIDEGVTYTNELYVAEGGDDGNDGSSGAPLATIRAAADRATPGTRITVRAGTYPAVNLGTVQGTDGAPIAFVADGNVIIDASSGNGWAMSDAAYVVIEGFRIENAMVHGMNLDDGGDYSTPAHHLVLRDLTVVDAGSGGNNDCIKMSGVDDFWVIGSDVSGCDMGEIIDMVGCHRGVIRGNYFHDTVQNGVQAKGGSADTVIHGNIFENIPGRSVNAGGSTGEPFFRPLDAPHEAANIRVFSNVFINSGASAIAYVGCDACVFAHNTLIRPQRWIARILQESTQPRFVPSRDGLFVNNLIVHDTSDVSAYVNVGPNAAPETFTFANNLWWATDQGAGWGGPSIDGSIPAETGAVIQMDPQLVDVPGGDYRLQSGSPAIGAARMESFPLPPDYDGRCYGEPASIGAFAAP